VVRACGFSTAEACECCLRATAIAAVQSTWAFLPGDRSVVCMGGRRQSRLWSVCQDAELAAEAAARAEQERREAIICLERQALLQRAAHLREFLPKGVLQSREELQLLQIGSERAAD
jgi:hypothetical protein